MMLNLDVKENLDKERHLLKKNLKKTKIKLLRTLAEMENQRRRFEKEKARSF